MVTVPPLAVVYTIRLVDMMVLPFFTETIKSGWFGQSFAWLNHPYTTESQLLADSQRVLLTLSPLSLDYSNHEGLHISPGCAILAIGREGGSTTIYSSFSTAKKPVLS